MSCYMTIEGTIKPMEGAQDKVKNILRENRIGIVEDPSGMIAIDFSDECGWSMIDDLVDDLEPLLAGGRLNVRVDDDDSYSRYEFEDGHCFVKPGTVFVYYKGDAEEFIRQLPESVIQTILQQYGK
jgi:hypothetical protein